ncbi:OmpA family protein [Maritimibacter sp. UBA3975]|uniref:OmpA family protein n=1 Tax=Maritimibacter sp. UBA3975 TaxID=1946833 RepID=UPI000C08DE09|nr:OmpA family protein [Maritimibacter sp. UBA3975]MAM61961.1 cell envelope biogenesis protein OmpA [Maritimibacter sp.]|tara:strand:+ start:5239 stop:6207 length:969 start_codon:yes stop_codon:yes gene_type:complete
MKRSARLLTLAALLAATALPARAELLMPAGAALRFEEREAGGTYDLPIGAHTGDAMPTIRTQGAVQTRAWRIGGTGLSSYQLILNFRQQLIDDGYDILFECDEDTCGGFDFRFATPVVQEPEMHVDLGDYHFLSAHVPGDSGMFTSVLVSRSASAGFIQIVEVSPTGDLPDPAVTSTKADPSDPDAGANTSVPQAALGNVGEAMERVGRYVLTDLRFETGSSALGEGTYDSLTDLAAYLETHPNRRVALVGHTDAEGPLSANITISRRRAASVLERLVTEHGIPAGRLEAEGVGYLSPLASNQSDEGRTLNRRVEAILITTE